MGPDRMARPDRADLAGGVVADGDDEVQRRRAGRGELVPALAAQPLARQAELLEQRERDRMHLALGIAARAVPDEAAPAPMVDQRFRDDAAGRIPGTEDQDV